MKKLFENSEGRFRDTYFLCESEEEYANELKKAKEKEKESEIKNPWGEGTIFLNPVEEKKIVTYPSTLVLDGYAVYGGRKFEAEGFIQFVQYGFHSNDLMITRRIIRPGTIKTNEITQTKEWWVS